MSQHHSDYYISCVASLWLIRLAVGVSELRKCICSLEDRMYHYEITYIFGHFVSTRHRLYNIMLQDCSNFNYIIVQSYYSYKKTNLLIIPVLFKDKFFLLSYDLHKHKLFYTHTNTNLQTNRPRYIFIKKSMIMFFLGLES